MQFPTCLAVLSALVFPLVNAQSTNCTGAGPITGILGNATVVKTNPVGPVYQAILPDQPFTPEGLDGNIKGSLTATANPNGVGVLFTAKFSNLPKSGGPFLYHLHVSPVPANGDCIQTLGHVDPFIRGETPPCDSSLPQTCQVGDLSGKHGAITDDPFTVSYIDDFASTQPGLGSFFGNRSLVIHYANVTRITCANFTLVGGQSTSNTTANATYSKGSSPPLATASSADTVGASTLVVFGVMALVTLFL